MDQERAERATGLSLDGTPYFDSPAEEPHWSEKFKYDLYDWDDPEWNRANRKRGKYRYVPLKLTKGYFVFVLACAYRRLTEYPDGKPMRWAAQLKRNRHSGELSVYAVRHGRDNEPDFVYMHRYLVDALYAKGPVDHLNGWGLDNRFISPKQPVNLWLCETPSPNVHNRVIGRRKNHGLPLGVEPRGKGRYGGIRSERVGKRGKDGKKGVVTHRSDKTWDSPEKAAKWYQAQMRKLYPTRKGWVYNPESVNFPEFPPRLDEEPSAESLKLRGMSAKGKNRPKSGGTGNRPPVHEDIPF